MAWIRKRVGKKGKISYTAVIRIAGHPTITETFDRRKDAEVWALNTEALIRSGGFQDLRILKNISFGNLLKRYMIEVSVKKKPNTQAREKTVFRELFEFFAGYSLADVTPALIAKYRDYRLRNIKPSTLQKERAFLSHLFNIAHKEWALPVKNPVIDVSWPAPGRGRLRFLTREEVQILLSSCRESRNKRLYPFVLTLLHTGMRPGEAAGLTMGQLDLERRIIELEDTKNNERRRIPVVESLAIELEKMITSRFKPGHYVFLPDNPSRTTLQRPESYFKNAFKYACNRAKIKDFHMHDCRHTAASHLIMSGVDPRTVAEILGHKTMSMVMRYTHLLDEHKRKALDKLNW